MKGIKGDSRFKKWEDSNDETQRDKRGDTSRHSRGESRV